MIEVLKTEQDKLSSRRAVQAEQWDSVESESENLAQERQQMLSGGYQENKYGLSRNEDADNIQQSEVDEEHTDDEQTQDLHDSLEVESHAYVKKKSTPGPTKYLETQINKTEETR